MRRAPAPPSASSGQAMGGVPALAARSRQSLAHIEAFVAQRDWISFLARDAATRSCTSVCLKLALPDEQVKQLVKLLQDEGVAYDIGSYKDAPSRPLPAIKAPVLL